MYISVWTLISILLLPIARCDIQSFNTVIQPEIDYNSFHNSLTVLGDFESISNYTYTGQSELGSVVGKHLYLINNEDQFKTLHQYTGTISQLVPIRQDSVLVVGDFNIGSVSSPVIYNTTSDAFVSINGWLQHVDGDIMSCFYDEDDDLIYFGGDLSYNDEVYGLVIYDVAQRAIVDSPFRGFNEDGMVTSIIKVTSFDDDNEASIIFGGFFNDLGDSNLLRHDFSNHTVVHHRNYSSLESHNISNTSITVDPEHIVSLKYARISTVNTDRSTSDDAGLIICPNNEANWLLNGQNVGSWSAALPFSVYPSKLRLYNAQRLDSGVQYFRIITTPTNGIMNMSYINPDTKQVSYCDSWCPLLNITYLDSVMADLGSEIYSINSTLSTGTLGFTSHYQEFAFVNSVSVESITVQVMSSYGNQAGLSGFEMYQSGIITYANDTFNEPNCDQISSAESDLHGDTWNSVTGTDNSNYLSTTISNDLTQEQQQQIGITFYPNTSYSGDYSVMVYTPGCNSDNTCSSRGIVNVTLIDGDGTLLESQFIYQNNEELKYDTIYSGHLNVDDGMPYVQMNLFSSIEDSSDIVMVADKIQLNLLSIDQTYYYNDTNTTTITNETIDSSWELSIPINGLFEYSLANFSNFNNAVSNVSVNATTNVYVGNSTINKLGSQILSEDAMINGLAVLNNTLFIAGDFSSSFGDNFLAVSLGSYNNTSNSTAVDEEDQIEGGGVNGPVSDLFTYDDQSLILVGSFNNTVNSTTATALNLTDDSSSLNNIAIFEDDSWYAFEDGYNSSDTTTFTNLTFHDVDYFFFNGDEQEQIWDNSHDYWIVNDTNLNVSLAVDLGDFKLVAGGKLSYMDLNNAHGSAILTNDTGISLLPFSLHGDSNVFYTGLYINDTLNVLGGDFNSSGIEKLIFVDSSEDTSFGVDDIEWDSDAQVVELFTQDDVLYIGLQNGATISGDHKEGLVVYDMDNNTLSDQPDSLVNDGDDPVRLNSITASDEWLYVGGQFTQAGSVLCSAICSMSLSNFTWASPVGSSSVSGVIYKMVIYDSENMLVSGNLTIDNEQATFAIVNIESNSIQLNEDLNTDMDIVIKNFILVDEDDVSNRVIAMGDKYLGYFNGDQWNSLTDDLYMNTTEFKDIQLTNLTETNDANDESVFNSDQILLVSGVISHQQYGNFSVGFYNGSSWIPYLFTDSHTAVNKVLQGKSMIEQITFSHEHHHHPNTTTPDHDHDHDNDSVTPNLMKLRNVVGVSFACALCTVLVLVVAYCIYYLLIGKNKIYGQQLKERVAEKDMLETVPPNELINSLDHAKYMAK